MLILVDDVWNEAHAQSFLVGGTGSIVLYSTRIPALAQRLAQSPEFIYSLPGLETPEAIELLALHAPDVVRDYPTLCQELVDRVEGLPLAIVVAGKLLQREQSHGEDIMKLLSSIRDDARTLLSESAPVNMTDLLEQTTPDVAAVLRRSTEGLDGLHKWYFAILAGLPPSPAPLSSRVILAGNWKVSPEEAKRIAKYFVDRGLLERSKNGYYKIHPLMHALALHEWDLLHYAGQHKKDFHIKPT